AGDRADRRREAPRPARAQHEQRQREPHDDADRLQGEAAGGPGGAGDPGLSPPALAAAAAPGPTAPGGPASATRSGVSAGALEPAPRRSDRSPSHQTSAPTA